MNRRTIAAAGAAAALCSALLNAPGVADAGTHAAARASTSASTWGNAQEVPGIAALNKGGFADVNSVSCPTAGDCGAGGDYADASLHQQAFVVSETNGTWRKAEEVPGSAALNTYGIASVSVVSCTSPGNCSAGGFYYVKAHDQQGFVVNETDGTWGTAQQVPGLSALNTERYAAITGISCTSPGNCGAGGYYSIPVDGFAYSEAFVVSEKNGTWGKAEEVPGTAALNAGGDAAVSSVSCAPAGNCSAGGAYAGTGTTEQAFVVNEVNGTWRKAEEVPGTAALNAGGDAAVSSVSCAPAGNCSAGGDYTGRIGKISGFEAFVVNEVNGTWRKAEEVPGTATLNKGIDAQTASVSCPSAGNCTAGGDYASKQSTQQVFVVSEANGTWGKAQEVPGTGTLNNAGFAGTFSLSCPSPGNCSAGGYYNYRASQQTHLQSVFVVSEMHRS